MNTTRSAQAAADGSCVTITSVRPPSSIVLAQEREHGAAGAGVERAGRLVGEDHVGLADERAGDRHALLLAARQLRRAVAGAVAEADALERVAHGRAGQPPAGEPRRQRDVLLGGQRAEQVERLEDEPDPLAAQPRERLLAEPGELEVAEADARRWSGGRGRRRSAAASTCPSPTGP